jgi:uncharacterized protein involved in exopolysaccharide biosynthesis/Mrp family chromosome partitioning ATPase
MTCLAAIGAVGGLAFFRFAQPVYEARGLVLVDPAGPDFQKAAASVLKSPAVFHAAVQKVSSGTTTAKGKNILRDEGHLSEGARVTPGSSNVLDIRVASPSRPLAIMLVNAWVSAYASAATLTNQDVLRGLLQSKGEALRKARANLAGIEAKVTALKKVTHITDIDAAVKDAATYEANLNQQRDQDLANLETTKLQAEQERKQLTGMPKMTEERVTQTVDPILRSKQVQLAQLEAEKVKLLGTWLPTSKVVTDVDDQIKIVESDIAKVRQTLTVEHKDTTPNPQRVALESSYFNHLAQIAGYKGSLSEVAKALEKHKNSSEGLPQAQLEMGRLSRDQGLAETVYKSLRTDYDALLNGTALPTLPALSAMSPAEASPVPIFPLLQPSLIWGAGAGAFLGLLGGLVVRPKREAPEVERLPGGPELPVLVTAPPLPARRGDKLEVLALSSSNPAEAYRFMVFSLQARENAAKTILFTAVSNDPLCAEAAAQFAVAMSQTGVRTLLIDCNLRDPSLTKSFGFLGKSGITDILSRTMLPSAGNDLVLETGHPDLFFLPAGTLESEGIGGFHNLQVQGMLQDVMDRADIKVVHTPACAVVSDASRLARHVDQVCLVANRQDQARGLVAKAEGILRLAGAREVEVVLIDEKRSRDSFLA